MIRATPYTKVGVIINVSLFNEYRYLKKLIYFNSMNELYGYAYKCEFDLYYCYNRIDEINRIDSSIEREYINLHHRKNTLNKHIKRICLNDNPVFLTLTFTDDILNNTTRQQRRRYVSDYLSQQCDDYVANIDFGKKNGREHYHACVSNEVDYSKWNKTKGIIDGIPIYNDSNALSIYIAKLSYHAIKDSTDLKSRLIYKREKRAKS